MRQQLAGNGAAPAFNQVVFNRVPKVTVSFWLIKLLAVTVGETAADYLAINLGYGLSTTTWLMSAVLAIALALQFARKKYVPWAYWLAVVLISIVGTLITDNMVDNLGIELQTSTIFFSVILAVTFAIWYAIERTLSIHTIYTTRREIFYWLAILFTFSLGTAAGDLVSEFFGLGYLVTGIIFGAIVAGIGAAYFVFKIDGILAFWLAYILTRPVGASLGDLLSQPTEYGGFGLGTVVTSWIFLGTIAAIILYMTVTSDGKEVVAKAGSEA
ncbi:MAG: COG4705 family protein [Dongiaceae bacterium]